MDENSNNTPLDGTIVKENNQVNIAGEEAIAEVEKKKTKGNEGLIVIIFILFFAVIAMGTYIFIKEGYFTEKNPTNTIEEEKKEEETVKEPELVKFQGEYLTTEIPQGWSIKEFKNGEESDMVTEGVQYSGLTKFEISHESKNIFRLEILDGVGSVGCSQIVLFKDSPEDFEEKQNQQNEEIGIQANVLDYTDTKYSEISLFGTELRRVETKVFYDTDSSTNTFEAQCESNWLVLKGLEEVSPVPLFNVWISQDASEEELTALDSILGSLDFAK